MVKNNRSKYLVDNKVQMALVRRIMFHWLVFMVLLLSLVLTAELFLCAPGTSLIDSCKATLQKNSLILVVMATLLPTLLYDTIKVTHRFAGPIARLKNSLSALADGKQVDEIKLRKDDFWLDLAADFNRVVRKLQIETKKTEDSSR